MAIRIVTLATPKADVRFPGFDFRLERIVMTSRTRGPVYGGVRRLMGLVVLTIAAIPVRELRAQGLPSFAPINPVATSRSGLYFQPYRSPMPGAWNVGLELEYASTIEYNLRADADYTLDSELLRINLAARRDLGRRSFVQAELPVRGAYDGFLDGFLDWYHDLLGITLRERDSRPHDEFLYRVEPAGAGEVGRASGRLFLGDLRLGAGWRYSDVLQGVASVTLPTATGPAGYGREVVSANLVHTVRAPVSRRLFYEGSLGLGYTPSHGPLASFQRETFTAASSGLRLGIWGRQALFANLFHHSPYYRGTELPALDRYDLAFDFGWILATCGGSEWRLGMVEDLKPSGPGVDLIFRLGVAMRTGTVPCAGTKTPSPRVHED